MWELFLFNISFGISFCIKLSISLSISFCVNLSILFLQDNFYQAIAKEAVINQSTKVWEVFTFFENILFSISFCIRLSISFSISFCINFSISSDDGKRGGNKSVCESVGILLLSVEQISHPCNQIS